MRKTWVILAVVLLLFPALTMAQPEPTSSIVISASPSEIPADGVSSSEIKVVVSWPEESNITGPAIGTLVDMSTNLGRLTEAENQSNSGSSIRLITDNNGTVTALLSGNETGDAEIMVKTLWGYNTTSVTFLADAVFDTDSSANPYPSIFGMHNGTIIPSYDINISELYTYPCVGTGGHTKYARIWNNSLNAIARWDGYVGDWHNISFDKSFTLEKGKTYNYTIKTGSYPQIIHETLFNATGGTITCTKFIDANGKFYNDRIPAIKFF
ncbi:MAG: hypothetical protein KAT65_16710 [Methanophagales archaeon]|nr:hypothetical protein [Methanophagales archaeon]